MALGVAGAFREGLSRDNSTILGQADVAEMMLSTDSSLNKPLSPLSPLVTSAQQQLA